MVDYTPLWKTIHEREITQYAMLQDKVLDNHTLDSLKRNMEHYAYHAGTYLQVSGLYAR